MTIGESLRTQVFFIIKNNPGILRTEVRDRLGMQNNIVGPVIKNLIDKEVVVEGERRLSKTTHRLGKELFLAEDWVEAIDAQHRIFE